MPTATSAAPAATALARKAFDSVPLIDFSGFLDGDLAARRAVASELGLAADRVGFFYIRGHGIAEPIVERCFVESQRFFALPEARKREIAIERSSCHRGYFGFGGENLDPAKQRSTGDFKEGLKIGRDLAADHPLVRAGTALHGPNQWPLDLPGWRQAMQGYYDACGALGHSLMQAFALALDLPEQFFNAWLSEPMATLAPLHYPPQQPPFAPSRLGAGAHSDFGCLSMVAQDQCGGLQVRNGAGQWLDVAPIEGTLVINIGDMLARWSNDRFSSTVHRVINRSGQHRYSLAFFYDPAFATPLGCLDTCQGPDRPPRYPPTTAGRYLLDRIEATFDYRKPDTPEGAE